MAPRYKGKGKQVTEVLFDEDARREYLTGFRKRNLAKKEAEKKKAIARDKRILREARSEKRRAMAEQAVENARLVEAAYGGVVDEQDGESSGREEDDENIEFEGEEQLATVTVVEDFDPHDLSGPPAPSGRNHSTKEPVVVKKKSTIRTTTKTPGTKSKKKQKFKYESKAARVKEKLKQGARRKGGRG